MPLPLHIAAPDSATRAIGQAVPLHPVDRICNVAPIALPGLFQWRLAAALILAAFLHLCLSLPASAREPLRGIALVIGNGDYEHLAPLANPENDAEAVEDLLDQLGFETYLSIDRDARRLRRDLENFIYDAQEADVALLYYAGHGIEAGGENFLVPVDAATEAIASDIGGLVAMNAFISQLRENVPVAVILLDACRTNPFPENLRLPLPGQPQPVAVSAVGLSPPARPGPDARGARALNASGPAGVENLVAMVGFAAEPGQAALDGMPGANSPYAEALLRHLGAANGANFSTVMSIVSEEVYLKTKGHQRPWINQSLRRQLFFGGTSEMRDADTAAVTEERRGLLVHIAGLSDGQRATVERLAVDQGAPMDVVYAVMRAAGIPATAPPSVVEAKLRARLDDFANQQDRAASLDNPDPEIQRLTKLADAAELEGALNAANRFRDQAKARVSDLRQTRDTQIAALKDRILEDADVFAKSARTKRLLSSYAAAAQDYETAFRLVKDWDSDAAFDYRRRQLSELFDAHDKIGLDGALSHMQTAARQEIETPSVLWSDPQKARFLKYLGHAAAINFRKTSGEADFEQAKTNYQRSIDLNGLTDPREAGMTRHDLAGLIFYHAVETKAVSDFQEAEAQLKAAKSFVDPDSELEVLIKNFDQTITTFGRDTPETDAALNKLKTLLTASGGTQRFEDLAQILGLEAVISANLATTTETEKNEQRAIDLYGVAAKMHKANSDFSSFALTVTNRGNLHMRRAARGISDAAALAFADYSEALTAISPETDPVRFSTAYDALLDVVFQNADQFNTDDLMQVVSFGQAWRSQSSNLALESQIQSFENSLARLHHRRGLDSSDPQAYETALEWYHKFQKSVTVGSADDAVAQFNIGLAQFEVGLLTDDLAVLHQAVDRFTAAEAIYGTHGRASDALQSLMERGRLRHEIALRSNDIADYEAALADYLRARDMAPDDTSAAHLADLHYNAAVMRNTIALHHEDVTGLNLAAQDFQKSAAFYTIAKLPDDALTAQFDAARMLHDAGYLTNDIATYKAAAQAYQMVLNDPGALSDERQFFVQLNLGYALQDIHRLDPTVDVLDTAVAHFESAMALVLANGAVTAPAQWDNRPALEADARSALAAATFTLGETLGDSPLLRAAADLYREIAAGTAQDSAAQASALNTAAYALVLTHRISADSAALTVAIDHAERALALAHTLSDDHIVPFVQGTLCDALIEQSLLAKDPALAERALPYCQRSLDTFRALEFDVPLRLAETSLQKAEAARFQTRD